MDADGRFTLPGSSPTRTSSRRQWTAPGANGKWTIKSSIANGRDAFDAPLLVNPNVPVDWTVTFTDTPATPHRRVRGRRRPRGDRLLLLVFPSDRRYWTPGSRRIRTTRPATDGAFTAKGLPPGEYFLAAMTDLDSGEWNDPALLEQLVKSSAT